MSTRELLAAAALATATTVVAPVQAQAHRMEAVVERVITRALVDIGSGDAKIVVADVYPESGRISRVLHRDCITVGLQKQLVNNKFTQEAGDEFIKTIKKLQSKALSYNPTQWAAVGTSVLHTAANGQELLDRVKKETDLDVLLVSHKEELLTSSEYWPITRAALDVGSAKTKIVVADVNPSTQKIVKVWHENKVRVHFEVDGENKLTKEMGDNLIRTIKQIQHEVSGHNPKAWVAIATEIFRKASNGKELIERASAETGLDIRIVSQNEEAELGFYTALGASGKPKNTIISSDIGSRSIQLSTMIDGALEVYGPKTGLVTVAEKFSEKHRNQPYMSASPNPISLDEVKDLIDMIKNDLPPPPAWFSDPTKQVVSIDGPNNLFLAATGRKFYTKEELMDLIKEVSGKTDEQLQHYNFSSSKIAVIGLTFLYALMEHCQYESNSHYPTTGSCEGLLVEWPKGK